MIAADLKNHPGWQWCTAEGAELHSLLLGLQSSLAEKIQWLEEAETLSLALQASRGKEAPKDEAVPTKSGEDL
jgi:hypothetical protein